MITVQDAWDAYNLRILSFKKKRNQFIEQGRWSNHIKNNIGHRLIEDLTVNDYLALRSSLEDKNLSPQTVSHCLSLLRRILKRAIDNNMTKCSIPSFMYVMPKFDNKRKRYLSEIEARDLLEELDGTNWYDAMLFALHTGMRKGEMMNLRKSDCDFISGFIHIVDTKTFKDRVIPMNSVSKDILTRLYARDGEFFFILETEKYGNKLLKNWD